MSNTKTKKKFEYRNEDDKAYGLAGMMISAGALNALELIHSVSLDAEGPMVPLCRPRACGSVCGAISTLRRP